jgi:predicted alpha-1,2-mannosidase
MGGKESFTRKLDSVFTLPPIYDESYYGIMIHEIREMQIMNMGQYAHGNQPIQHMIYLYNYAGQPWKSQFWARKVMDKLYHAGPDGYCGDEDNGQTSAWYVFSALGLYPVCPVSDEYVLGSPLFEKAILTLENSRQIVIESRAANITKDCFIESVTFNGKPHEKSYFRFSDLKDGAKVEFLLSDKPNYNRAVKPESYPFSLSQNKIHDYE